MSTDSYASIVSRAEEAWSKDRYELAADIYMSIDDVDVVNDLLEGGDLAADIAYALRYAGRSREAIKYINEIFSSYKLKLSNQKFCQLQIALADCFIDLRQPKQSIDYLLPIKNLHLHNISLDLQVKLYCTLSNAYHSFGDYERCLAICSEALKVVNSANIDFGDKKDTLLGLKALAERASGLLDLSLTTYEARLHNASQSSQFTEVEIFFRQLDVMYITSLISGDAETWLRFGEDWFYEINLHLQSMIKSCVEANKLLAPQYTNAFWTCIDLLYMQKNFLLANDLLNDMYDYHENMLGRNFGLAKVATFLGESYLKICNIEEAKRCGHQSYGLALEELSLNPTDGTLMFAKRIVTFLMSIKMTKESQKIGNILKKYASARHKNSTNSK